MIDMKKILIILLLSSITGFSQTWQEKLHEKLSLGLSKPNPGYLGKKLSIGYNFHMFPAFSQPNDIQTKDFSWSLRHHISIENSFRKNASFIYDVGFFSTYTDIEYNGFNNLENQAISALQINMGYKWYVDHFAPLGNYLEFRSGFMFPRISDVSLDNDPNTALNGTISGGTAVIFNFGFGYGVQRVLFDQVLVGMGLDINIGIPGLGRRGNVVSLDLGEGYDTNSKSNQDSIMDYVKARVFEYNLISFKTSISYLF
jgi:hypothetical protein